MPEIFKQKIIKLLKHDDYTPSKPGKLAKALGIGSDDYEQFKKAFEQLQQAGQLIIGERNQVSLPPLAGRITGKFRANQKGFGFVIPQMANSSGDLFIPPDSTAGAMTGDLVSAKVIKQGRRAGQMRYTGKIVEILQRGQNKFVGTLSKKNQSWMVQPDGTGFTEPIFVDDVTAKNAKPKDKVVVEILSWPTGQYPARGVIIEVLGKSGQYDSEIKSIIHQYNLAQDFNQQSLEQARQASEGFGSEKTDHRQTDHRQLDHRQLDHRQDISDKVIITIDPPDSKDFDDAISLEKNSTGNYVLGVHIADVSSFVPPETALDIEAKERGNSVYLPGKTIPMLPEILSNGICSLQPNQKRYVKSAYITYDRQGNVIKSDFANSIICSTKRLTYKQADRILNGHKEDTPAEVIALLKNMETLSRLIEQRRIKNQMLHLDLPDTELIMDKAGRVVDAAPADDCYPHTIIEMFMVEANEAVAALFNRLNVPLMRRVHPNPDPLSMKNLSKTLKAFGCSLPRTPERGDIQNLLKAVKGSDCSFAVNLVVLRSFEKAEYSPLAIGHYALGSKHYCHFTSPIRRYADLLVHRVLQCYLEKKLDSPPENWIIAEQDLAEVGKHITFTEQQSERAENELKTVLLLQMLSSKIGDELDTVVTGLTSFGIFVQCRKFGIEGLIRIEDLGPDNWKLNQKSQSIAGPGSGVSIHLGQPLKTRIISVNVPARQLNLAPAEPLIQTKRKKTKEKKPKTKNGKRRRYRRK